MQRILERRAHVKTFIALTRGLSLYLIVAAGSLTASAATYVVSTSGQDGPSRNGSSTQPWKTVAYAATRAVAAGDTISVAQGTYTETQQIVLRPGVSLQGAGQSFTTLTVAAGFQSHAVILMTSTPIATNPANVFDLTIDGAKHLGTQIQLTHGIEAQGRSNLTFHHLTIKNCKTEAITMYGGQTLMQNLSSYVWPRTIAGPASVPTEADYVDNIKIYDSTFTNNTIPGQGASAGASIWFIGVKNLNIFRILMDETASGGFGVAGRWTKNARVWKSDFRMQPRPNPNSTDGFAIEIWYTTGGEIFDNVLANGGISMTPQYDVRIHHNRFTNSSTLFNHGIEFGGFRSTVDYNYFENTFGVLIWDDSDILRVQHNVFRNTQGSVFVSTSDSVGDVISPRNIDIDNNTIDGNVPLYNEGAISLRIQRPQGATISNIRIRNNIIVNSKGVSSVNGGAISLNGLNGACDSALAISNVLVANNVFNNNLPGDFSPINPGQIACGVPFTSQGNKFATNPAFVGGTTFPSPYYRLAAGSPARAAGLFIGLPYELAGPPDIGAYVQPSLGQSIEAEMAYSVAANVGTNSPVVVGNYTLASSGHGVTLYDVGDKARLHFNIVAAGSYTLSLRVRSGGTGAPTSYFQSYPYSFQLDGTLVTLTPVSGSISAFDSSGGGVYWGTLRSQPIALSAGPHSIEVGCAGAWAMLDSLVIQ
jgi:hypothetical protein